MKTGALRSAFFSTRRRIQLGFLGFTAIMFCLFFLLLTFSYTQVKRHTLRDLRKDAAELSRVIEERLLTLLAAEEKRTVDEYSFYSVYPNKLLQASAVAYSPLSEVTPKSVFPGTLGYFQIDPDGRLKTPLLPDDTPAETVSGAAGLSTAEIRKRHEIFNNLSEWLRGKVSDSADAPDMPQAARFGEKLYKTSLDGPSELAGQSSFLNYLSADDGTESFDKGSFPERLHESAQALAAEQLEKARRVIVDAQQGMGAKTQARKERIEVPVSQSWQEGASVARPGAVDAIVSFEGEIDPLRMRAIGNGKAVFFRRVWRDRARYVQGFLVDVPVLLSKVVEPAFRASHLQFRASLMAGLNKKRLLDLNIVKQSGGADELTGGEGRLIYRRSLSAPYQELELVYWIERIPFSVGSLFVVVLLSALTIVLLVGVLALYSLVLAQVDLAEKKNDFVSAVSHELKTPLTSIRLYAEMLKAGWVADEEKKQNYFEFIFNESERLSRLITKILQFARTKNEIALLKRFTPDALVDTVKGKVLTLAAAAGFELAVEVPPGLEKVSIMADEDAFVRIIINLVENALKFAKAAPKKLVVFGCRTEQGRRFRKNQVVFYVRDFGPGILAGHEPRIFEPFYRAESELVRSTPGTGLGLAIVKELAATMHAKVAVSNRSPGAEFEISFSAI